MFEKSEVKVWECRNCGHVVVGTKAPEICPVMIGCGFVGSASVGKEALKFKKSADALKKVIETS